MTSTQPINKIIPTIKEQLTPKDIEELKLTCGLEIHQQLEGKKLFCTCPTTIRDDTPDRLVKRSLRASAGESGKIDAAAKAEMNKKKTFVYEAYNDTTCLVELDEEPPRSPNKEAVIAAEQMSVFLNTVLVDQIRFMRKTVVDGSNTSGFQRTALVGTAGFLEVDEQKIGIESVAIEEDSCKRVETKLTQQVYNLSRLGIPLIEIATAPDIHTPQLAQDVAQSLGLLLRSLPNVKRGLGTIRQDVNVSIAKGVRVELKGAQDLKLIPTLVECEMLRQYNMLEIFSHLKKVGASVGDICDITSLLKNSESKVLKSGLEKKDGVVLALPLYGFAGVTGIIVQPNRRFGTELSDHAKLFGVKGLFHADELPNYGITQEEKESIFSHLTLDSTKDNFVLICAPKEQAQRAMHAVQDRAKDFTLRKEVRMARPDGSSQYMRPMPGSARMYPETDVHPILVEVEKIVLPKLLSERISELSKKHSLAIDIAKKLIRDDLDIDMYVDEYSSLKPQFIVDVFYSYPSMLKKKHSIEASVEDIKEVASVVFEYLDANKITKDAVIPIMASLLKNEDVDFSAYAPLQLADIKEEIKQIVNSMPEAPMGAIIGKVLANYAGRVDGKEISAYIAQLKNN